MSDEQRKDGETEVEGHVHKVMSNDEPRDETETEDEVEGHQYKVDAPKYDAPKYD